MPVQTSGPREKLAHTVTTGVAAAFQSWICCLRHHKQLTSAWRMCDVFKSCQQVDALQMHGTGTSLGDPIEINGALSVLMAKRRPVQPLSLAASKAAAGHAEPAAGILGLACAICSLEAHALPKLLHLRYGHGC